MSTTTGNESTRKHTPPTPPRGQPSEGGDGLHHLVGVREVVVAGVDVLETQFTPKAYEVEDVGEALNHVGVAVVLEES